jgi:hypothetical protein
MTEAEWVACTDPKRMLDFLRPRASKRRLRLFAVAGARDLLEHNPNPDARGDYGDIKALAASILRAEAYADGHGSLQYAHSDLGIWVEVPEDVDAAYAVLGYNADVGMWFRDPAEVVPAAIQEFQVNPSEWLRCIFGNPFRPPRPVPTAVLVWNDGTIRRIAQGIYDDAAFNRLPILADALLDAGCDDEELIQHCRSAGPHVRGCWAVDLILGKE